MMRNCRPACRCPILFTVTLFHLLLVLFPLLSIAGSTGILPDSADLSRKNIVAIRATTAPKIDGNSNDLVWRTAPVADDFIEYGPRNGTLPALRTEIRFAYDDMALYILAVMFDPHPDSICKELGRRDQIEALNTDYISFDILPYNDGLNMYEFKVSPANLQNDCKYTAIGQDVTWDAVWESATVINDSAWITELKIPYSALRFPKVGEQIWGINMWRNIHRFHEYSTWSWVDNKSQDIFRYYGTLTGIGAIKPPLRLSFSPYISGYLEKGPESKNWSYFFRRGLDLRYGINESYTLDMMLIPDFGQVQSDDQVLNLSPFEIRYDEKRQFFTEATELFDKCEIFYSRRVGSLPKYSNAVYDSLRQNEKVSKNPDQTRIINATKISGRNLRGLGIGLFNGMTINTWANLQDTITGESRRIRTQPFTNYNVLVFDQNLKNNSYVTLINTNYWTPDDGYSANVSGAETSIKNRKGNFQVFGRFNLSQKYLNGINPDFGHQYTISISKPGGKFQYQLLRQETGATYDPNDMGFISYNNEATNRLRLSWYDYDPKGKIVNTQTDLVARYITLHQPYDFKTLDFSLNNSIVFVKYWINVLYAAIQPLGFYDFYEPRIWGRVYKMPFNFSGEWRFASNDRKPIRYHHNFGFMNSPENNNFIYFIGFTPRVRFSDRFSATLDMQFEKELNNYGWVRTSYDSLMDPTIFFGRRDITTINNILNIRYIFNTKASLTLRARHYWSQAKYLSFYTLEKNGSLNSSDFIGGRDINFNAFTIDLQFVWYFAPGSEMSVVWKNAINTTGSMLVYNYFTDIGNTLNSPQSNSFSVRILYYLDYLNIRKAFSKKQKSSNI
ncbi:MAG: DUF5916 domain-containing protein [Bacteroidales bacterium]|nr:DUF5916 domain-containing protein [Bacteroidales bacterium]